MSEAIARPRNLHARYHAHVYFDAATVARARALCEAAGERFGVRVGRVHEKRVGPHPCWSCQLAFGSGQFDALMAWLEAHRGGLDVLVHGDTGDDWADHTRHVAWLGQPHALDLSVFARR